MTRKDYELIAEAISRTRFYVPAPKRPDVQRYGIDAVANSIANSLATDNPRFDRARFLKACGIE